MHRRQFLAAVAPLVWTARIQTRAARRTEVSIRGDAFAINGQLTYPGRSYRGMRVEGLLMNARLVQGIFDDRNPETRSRWNYPDTGAWDPERNTREFLAAMPEWRRHGLLAFTINLQGGSPQGYSREQPWHNSAFEADGSLRPDYMGRLEKILDRADALGMVAIVGYFYFGQDQRLRDDDAVRRGAREATRWLLDRDYHNILVEVANECDNNKYERAALQPARIDELIRIVKSMRRRRRRLLAGTSFNGGRIPAANVVAVSDFVLLHGNGVSDPRRISEMAVTVRQMPEYRPMPIVFNEDDHFDFEKPANNMMAAVASYASWGYFDPGKSDYSDGYQVPPVQWSINTERKKAFFGLLKEMTGS
ncbi:MAG: hypothetical protein ACR2L2_02785 [Acidobacteriota bacterium]